MLTVSHYPILFRKWSEIKNIQVYILGEAKGIVFEHPRYLSGRKCEKPIWVF